MRNHLLVLPMTLALVSASLNTAAAATTGPVVSGLSASSGPLGGGEKVTLHGSGFGHVSKVMFGSAAAHHIHLLSPHTLTAVVPRHGAGRVDVHVVAGTASSRSTHHDRFTYVAPPTVSTLTVGSGTTDGGVRVVLRGKQFLHVRSVLFGAAEGLAVHVTSPTSLAVTSPARGAGTVDLRVVTAYGTSMRHTADHFTFTTPTVAVPIPPVPTPTPTPPVQNLPPAPGPPAISTLALPVAVQGDRYGATFAASSGTPPYTWSAHGLPGGLVLSTAGVLSGLTRASAGTKRFQVTVTDSTGQSAAVIVPLTLHPFGGQLYAWGANSGGTVGDGTTTDAAAPVKIKGLPSVVSVCGTLSDSLAVQSDGTVWAWGANGGGLLGAGDTTPLVPAKVAGVPSAASITCGSHTVFALTSAGTVYAWGTGTDGELGNGGTQSNDTPSEVPGLTDIVAVSAGVSTAFAVRADGTIFAWGTSPNANLGNGSTSQALTPIVIPDRLDVSGVADADNDRWALHADGSVTGWGFQGGDSLGDGTLSGSSEPTPVSIPGLFGTVQLIRGQATDYAVNENGTVLAWGVNNIGQAGNGAIVDPLAPVQVATVVGVQAVGSGFGTAYALLGDGTVWGWGFNSQGEIGDGTMTRRTTPVAVSGLKNVVGLGVSIFSQNGFAIEDPVAPGAPIPPFH